MRNDGWNGSGRPDIEIMGRTLVGADLGADRETVTLRFSDRPPVIGVCRADCCSETWIEHIEEPAGYPAVVTDAGESIDMPRGLPTTTGRYEDQMAFYGYQIQTSQGPLRIEYRNSSNGYYGGDIEWREVEP